MILHKLDRYRNTGILILRLLIGIYMIMHGYKKLDPANWERLGSNMQYLGITFGYGFWGFMAMFGEFFGGILLILGLFFRPATFLIFFTMLVAIVMHIVKKGDPIKELELNVVYTIIPIALFLIGPGKFSIDEQWHQQRKVNKAKKK